MNRLALLAAAAAALAIPRAADAECHHGGGGGGNVSTSSEGHSYVAPVYSASEVHMAPPPGCVEVSDVVGYRTCTKYGEWATNMKLPHIFVETGGTMRHFSNMLGGNTGSVSHGSESFTYRVMMPGPQPADIALTSSIRIGVASRGGFYGALEGEGGTLASPAAATAEMTSAGAFGSPELAENHGAVFGGYAVGGFRHAGSHGALAIEGAGGVRTVMYGFDSTYHDCQTSSSIDVTRPVLEARARGEMWLGPWLALGATVGANALARGDYMMGAYIGIHSRAYGGTR